MRSCRKCTAPAMPSNRLRGLSGMFCSGLTSSVSHSPNLAALYSQTWSSVTCRQHHQLTDTLQLSHLIKVKESVAVAGHSVTQTGTFPEQTSLPDHLPRPPRPCQVLAVLGAPHLV